MGPADVLDDADQRHRRTPPGPLWCRRGRGGFPVGQTSRMAGGTRRNRQRHRPDRQSVHTASPADSRPGDHPESVQWLQLPKRSRSLLHVAVFHAGGLHLTSREAELAEVAVDSGGRCDLSGLHRARLGRSALAYGRYRRFPTGTWLVCVYPVAPGAVAAGAELALGPRTPHTHEASAAFTISHTMCDKSSTSPRPITEMMV